MKNKIYNPTKIYTFDYNEDVKDERWIQKSLALKNRAQWTCQRCGAIDNVVVHHPYYLDGLHLWDYPDTVYTNADGHYRAVHSLTSTGGDCMEVIVHDTTGVYASDSTHISSGKMKVEDQDSWSTYYSMRQDFKLEKK